MKAPLQKLAYSLFAAGSKVARSTGLANPLRRTIGALAGRLVFRATAISDQPISVNGHRMVLATDGGYPPIAMAMDRYEIETTRLFERVLTDRMVVVDVGAHAGYFSLTAARKVGPRGRVYSFEPAPANYELLLRNIELNDYANIMPVNQALSDKVGPATLYLTELDSGRHSTYHHDLPIKETVAIETTTADAFLEAQGWPKVDLVKIDVEGAELDVLDGMAHLIEKSAALKIIVEFNPGLLQSAGVNPSDLLQKPASMGFEAHRITETESVLPLYESGHSELVDQLLSSDGTVNLYWIKK